MNEYSERVVAVAKKMQDLRDKSAPSDGGYHYEDAATVERVLAALAQVEPVLTEVGAERATHVGRGFGREHDASHNVHHLVVLAERYAHRSDTGYYGRTDLVKAASLLVAAIERFDVGEEDR